MAEENKKSIDELQTSADSLLARLNGQLGAEASKPEKDVGAATPDDGHSGGLTDEKYNELYEKYLGEKPSQGTGSSGYEALHGSYDENRPGLAYKKRGSKIRRKRDGRNVRASKEYRGCGKLC